MIHNIKNWIYRARVLFKRNALEYIVFFSCSCAAIIDAYNFPARKAFTYLNVVLTGAAVAISLREKDESLQIIQLSSVSKLSAKSFIFQYLPLGSMDYCIFKDCETYQYIIPIIIQPSPYNTTIAIGTSSRKFEASHNFRIQFQLLATKSRIVKDLCIKYRNTGFFLK